MYAGKCVCQYVCMRMRIVSMICMVCIYVRLHACKYVRMLHACILNLHPSTLNILQAMNVLLIEKICALPRLSQHVGAASAQVEEGAGGGEGGAGAQSAGAGWGLQSHRSMSMWSVGVWEVAPAVEQVSAGNSQKSRYRRFA